MPSGFILHDCVQNRNYVGIACPADCGNVRSELSNFFFCMGIKLRIQGAGKKTRRILKIYAVFLKKYGVFLGKIRRTFFGKKREFFCRRRDSFTKNGEFLPKKRQNWTKPTFLEKGSPPRRSDYLPTQKCAKIEPSTSAGVTSPVTVPSASSASSRSCTTASSV